MRWAGLDTSRHLNPDRLRDESGFMLFRGDKYALYILNIPVRKLSGAGRWGYFSELAHCQNLLGVSLNEWRDQPAKAVRHAAS